MAVISVYQTPRQLSELDDQVSAGAIHFRAATSPDRAGRAYHLYALAPDGPGADVSEHGRSLLVRVDEDGGVHEVAGPRILEHLRWGEDILDRLWEQIDVGVLPMVEAAVADTERRIVGDIIAGPPPNEVRPSFDSPYRRTARYDVPRNVEEFAAGDGVSLNEDSGGRDASEHFIVEVIGEGESGRLVVQSSADDAPFSVRPDQVEVWLPAPPVVEPRRFKPDGQRDLAPSGRLTRIRANIAAIRVLRRLREEERPATSEEQAVLARWSSWGAVPQIFDPRKREFAGLRGELRSLLTEAEWNAAEATTRNAHFTDASLVAPVWQALADLGFARGRVLEPGCGSGNFIAYAPEGAQMTGVELDPVTAEIAAALYPDAEVRAESFVATRMPEAYYDAAVGNVPFDEIALTDPVHNPLRLSTHNHFIVKALELVRPGGLVAVLTSRYTMDSMGKTARLEIAERADLVGAVRLPAGAHRAAAGTEAVTDLLVLRRRDGEPPEVMPNWVGLSSVQVVPETSVLINSYFADRPEFVLGTLGVTTSQFTDKDLTVHGSYDTDLPAELTKALATITREAREGGLTMSASPDARQRAAVEERAERMRRAQQMFGEELHRFEGTILDQHDKTFLQVVGGELVDRLVFQGATDELASLLRLRDTYIKLLSAESSGVDETADELRTRLNHHYETHVSTYGFLNAREKRRDRRSAHGAFRTDPYAAGVYALEAFDKDTGVAKKSTIFSRAVTKPEVEEESADTPQDALAISLNTYGKVRLGEITRLLGLDTLDKAREALGDAVFNEPGTQRLVPAAEYLSGNVREKLEAAQGILRMVSDESRAAHPLQANVAALRNVLPPDAQPGDIDDIQFGATWVDAKYYEQFLREILQTRYLTVTRKGGADWEIEAPRAVRQSRAATKVYGTAKRNAVELALRMLRRSSLVVRPPKPDDDASPDDIKDAKRWAADQTEQVIAKAEELSRLFADWLWQDVERTTDVLATYNRLYNSYVPYRGDGNHLKFPGLSNAIVPRPHQRAGVARVLSEPYGSFLDYEVGFGKTYTIAMSLMEMKRLGMVRKPCVVVKNPTINDFRNDFLKAYPAARVLAIDSTEFTKETAAAYVAQIANGDWDAVILPQSLFKRIPVSGRGQAQFVAHQTAEYRERIHKALTGDESDSTAPNPGGDPLISEALDAVAASSGTGSAHGAPSRATIKNLQGDLKRHTQQAEKNLVKQTISGISWEQTGIDFITVDEVQDFANGELGANNSELSLTVSAQAKDLKVKLHTMFKAYGRKVGMGSTGTPFPNAMPQAFVMLDYFRRDLLAAAGVDAFPAFQAQFLTEVVAPEISPEGVPRIKERIGAFRNAKVFSQSLWGVMADVNTSHDITLPIPKRQSATEVVLATAMDRIYMAEIADRAEEVRAGNVDASTDNLLKISNDGRQAAMDLRMVGLTPDGPGKIDAAARKIFQIWGETKDRAYTDREGNPSALRGALQLVFADRGTPSEDNRKQGNFIAYDYLRNELVRLGIPEERVRYAQDAKNAEEKERLFADCRNGKVSVLIGSTETMGVGVNVQDRAAALHHLDCPWRPSDVAQREGRIVRQFNQHYDLNIPVQIVRWVKEGSFDSFMWQTVERKARFIDQVRTGRELDEQDQALDGDLGKEYLDYGEIKAIATGNPLLMKKLAADETTRQLEAAFKSWKRTNTHLRGVVDNADETLATANGHAERVQRAALARVETAGDAFRAELPDGRVVTKRQDAAVAVRTALALHNRRMRGSISTWEPVGTIGGQPFVARINGFHDFIEFAIQGLQDVPGISFTVDDVNAIVSDPKPPLGLIARIENSAERLDTLHTTLLGVVDELEQEIARAHKLVDKPFGKLDKLHRARAEQAQLEAEIEAMADGGYVEDDQDLPDNGEGDDEASEMSEADMALHDAQVMAAEFGGVGVVIKDGQWFGTATGLSSRASDDHGPADGEEPERQVVFVPDDQMPDFTSRPDQPISDPEEMVEIADAANEAVRIWLRTETADAQLADPNGGDERPDGAVPNPVTALYEAYRHALRYRDDDPAEWTRRYGNVIAQARALASRLAAEASTETEQLDLTALQQVDYRIHRLVVNVLASREAHQDESSRVLATAEPTSAERGQTAPYRDRAEYWAAEKAAMTAYGTWAEEFGAHLTDGTRDERALAVAAELMITESRATRSARLLGLDDNLEWKVAEQLAARARAVGEQWDREQRAARTVTATWSMHVLLRDHAARYRATVEDIRSEAYQRWAASDESLTPEDEAAEPLVISLEFDGEYLLTGPGGLVTDRRKGSYLSTGIRQLVREGATFEETPRGLRITTSTGDRFEVSPASAASPDLDSDEGRVTPEPEDWTEGAALEHPGNEPGSATPQARSLAVLLGPYADTGEFVAGRKAVADGLQELLDQEGAKDSVSPQIAGLARELSEPEQDPTTVFGRYDRLAAALGELTESSRGEVGPLAERLLQRTERHLGRMHADGEDLVDRLIDAVGLDPDSWAVAVRSDPLKEQPSPYTDATHLAFARRLVFETYDKWPEVDSDGGREFAAQLRGAMWQIRQGSDIPLAPALPGWMQVVTLALAAAGDAESDISRSVLRDLARRAYQHHQGLAAHQLAAEATPAHTAPAAYTEAADAVSAAWTEWMSTPTAQYVADVDRPHALDVSLARGAQEEIGTALYAAEWSSGSDGTLDELTRRTTRAAHAVYELIIALPEGAFRQPSDEVVLRRLTRACYQHAAALRASTSDADGTEAVLDGLRGRQERQRAEQSDPSSNSEVTEEGSVEDASAEEPAELTIEHHHLATVVHGTTDKVHDASVRRALHAHDFKFNHTQRTWYLRRNMKARTRALHVQKLQDELSRLGRAFRVVDRAPDRTEPPREAAIPEGRPYELTDEARSDFSEMMTALNRMRETPAGRNLLTPGVGSRPDGAAVWVALQELIQGAVYSNRDPFAHPAALVAERVRSLAGAVQNLDRALTAERFRAPVALRHFRLMVRYVNVLASRVTATAAAADGDLWNRLFSPEKRQEQQQNATVVREAEGPAPEWADGDATVEPTKPTAAPAAVDPLVAGAYRGQELAEVVARLDSLHKQVAEELATRHLPDRPRSPAEPSETESWFRGPAKVELPPGFVPFEQDGVSLQPGDLVRVGFKRWLESRALSYVTLTVKDGRPEYDGWCVAEHQRFDPKSIVAVPQNSRLLSDDTQDEYTARWEDRDRWEVASSTGQGAITDEARLGEAVTAYRDAFLATGRFIALVNRASAPSGTRDLVTRLLSETEHHVLRLAVTARVAEEADQGRESSHARHGADDSAERRRRRVAVEEAIAASLEHTHAQIRERAARFLLSHTTVRSWLTQAQLDPTSREVRQDIREALRALSIPDEHGGGHSRFTEWFDASGPGAEDEVAEQVIDDVLNAFASEQIKVTAPQREPTAEPASAAAQPLTGKFEEPEPEPEAPGQAGELAATARGNGWHVEGSWADLDKYSTRYELTLKATTARGNRSYLLVWEMKRGRHVFNRMHSMAWHLSGLSAAKGFRPRLADVQTEIQQPAVRPAEGEQSSPPPAPEVVVETLATTFPDTGQDSLFSVDPDGAEPEGTEQQEELAESEELLDGGTLTEAHLRALPMHAFPGADDDARLAVVVNMNFPDGRLDDVLLFLQSVELDQTSGADPIVHGAQYVPPNAFISDSLNGRWTPDDLLGMADARVVSLPAPIPWAEVQRLPWGRLREFVVEQAHSAVREDTRAPSRSSRRFASTGQLRTHYKAAPLHHLQNGSDGRRQLQRLAAHESLVLSPDGQFAVVQDTPGDEFRAFPDSAAPWSLRAAGSGMEYGRIDEYGYLLELGLDAALPVMNGFRSRWEAEAFAQRLARLRDHLGAPVEWDDPELPRTLGTSRFELDRLVLQARAEFDREMGQTTSPARMVWNLLREQPERSGAPEGQIHLDDVTPGDRVWFGANDDWMPHEVVSVRAGGPAGLFTVLMAELIVEEDDGTPRIALGDQNEWDAPRNLLLSRVADQQLADVFGVSIIHRDPVAADVVARPRTAGPEAPVIAEPADPPQPKEEPVAVTEPEPSTGPWSARIQIITEGGSTFVTGTGANFHQEAPLRELLKKNRNFAFGGGRWRYQGRGAKREQVLDEVRAWLRAKDAQEAAREPAALTEYPPTAQQQAIIDAILAGQDVAVQALAGTGKTSTLQMVTRRLPDKRIAYVAFNRSIADEGKRKFPRNVTADTSHWFARAALRNTPLSGKIGNAGRNGGARRPKDVAKALRLLDPIKVKGGAVEPEDAARVVLSALRHFRESADPELTVKHLGAQWATNPVAGQLLDLTRRAWADICDPASNKIYFSHDDYLKIWALTEPRLNYDLILFDEAQDINPVLAKVIQDQETQTVVVGDSNQAIYEFRGAIDALKDWPADVVLPLTQSWRFGPEAAAVGNTYLGLLGSELVLEGNPALNTTVGAVDEPDAVLTRTNVGAIGAVFAGFDAGKQVALVGGGRDIEDIAKAAQDLQSGRRTKHPELGAFASWSEVREYAETEDDKSLQTFIRLVDRYSPGGLLGMIRDLVDEEARDEETRPELVVSTAHKAKGREWPLVRIGSDFPQPKETQDGNVDLPGPEELRLAYVTVTRAQQRLELGSLSWIQTVAEEANTPHTAALSLGATPATEQHEVAAPETAPATPVTGPTTAIMISAGDRGQVIVGVAIDDRPALGRPVPHLTVDALRYVALPIAFVLPSLVPPARQRESLVGEDEVEVWLTKHLSGDLASAWANADLRLSITSIVCDALRETAAPTVREIADWLVSAAIEEPEAIQRTHADDLEDFRVVFATWADNLITGVGAENLVWGYLHGSNRQVVLDEAAPLVYERLRQLENLLDSVDGPLEEEAVETEASVNQPDDERLEPAVPEVLIQDGNGDPRTANPDEIETVLGGMRALDGTPYIDIYNEVVAEAAAADGRSGSAPRSGVQEALSAADAIDPLPWDDDKIQRRAVAGTRRAETSSIPNLARAVSQAIGVSRARDVWQQDHPFDQFDANVKHVLADLDDDAARSLIEEMATGLRAQLEQIADRAAEHFTGLITPHAGEPQQLASLDERLTTENRLPELHNPFVREALICALNTLDEAERRARSLKVKASVVRPAFDQIVGLAGSTLVNGHRFPHLDAALAPIKVQLDKARETMAELGLNVTLLDEYARLRDLIVSRPPEEVPQSAPEPAAVVPTSAAEPVVPPLTPRDIAAALHRISGSDFGQFVFDMDQPNKRTPELYDGFYRMPSTGEDSTEETAAAYSSRTGLDITVRAGDTVVRSGKITWSKVLSWIRPALTPARRTLVTETWRTARRLTATEDGFEAIGEYDRFRAARTELRSLLESFKEAIISESLQAHESGRADELVARNRLEALEREDVLISLDQLMDPAIVQERRANVDVMRRMEQLQAVLPERHSVVTTVREVTAGDTFWQVSPQRLLFVASGPARTEGGRFVISGELLLRGGESRPYDWSGDHWTADTGLPSLQLPGSLSQLVVLPTDPAVTSDSTIRDAGRAGAEAAGPAAPPSVEHEPIAETKELSLVPARDSAGSETVGQGRTDSVGDRAEAAGEKAAEVPVEASGAGDAASATALPAGGDGADPDPYPDRESYLQELTHLRHSYEDWERSETGRPMLAEARELREETGVAAANDAALIEAAWRAANRTAVRDTDPRTVASGFEQLADVVTEAGRSMDLREAFAAVEDRRLLQAIIAQSRQQAARLDATARLLQGRPLSSEGVGEDLMAESDVVVDVFDSWRDVIEGDNDNEVGGGPQSSNEWGPDSEDDVRRISESVDYDQRPAAEEMEEFLDVELPQPESADVAPTMPELSPPEDEMASEDTETADPEEHSEGGLDERFNSIVAMLGEEYVRDAGPTSAPANTLPGITSSEVASLLAHFEALRTELWRVLGDVPAEPTLPVAEDGPSDRDDAAALDAAVGAAQDEAPYYWGTPEWESIREVRAAALALRAATRRALGTVVESVGRDARVHGLDRAVQAAMARALSHAAFALARRLDRGGLRDTGAWRVVWRLHRAAATRADRLTGVLPAGRRIDLADQVSDAWLWLGRRTPGGSTDQPEPEPNRIQTMMASGLTHLTEAYQAAADMIGDLAQSPAWRRITSVFESARSFLANAWQGTYRLSADQAMLGTGRTLWIRTVELIAHGARTLLDRLARSGNRDGLRWNALRVLHHAAEEHISHQRGLLPEDVNSPLGAYYDPSPVKQEQTVEAGNGVDDQTPRVDEVMADAESAQEERTDPERWTPVNEPFRSAWFNEVRAALPRGPQPVGEVSRSDMINLLFRENHRVVRRQTDRAEASERANHAVELYLAGRGNEVPNMLAGEGFVYAPGGGDDARWEIHPRENAEPAPVSAGEPAEDQSVGAESAPRLPQRRRIPADPAIAATTSPTRRQSPAPASDQRSDTQKILAVQASRLEDRGRLAVAAATTPAERRNGEMLFSLAAKSRAAAEQMDAAPETPTRGTVMAEPFLAALRVHAAAKGAALPEDVVQSAWSVAAKVTESMRSASPSSDRGEASSGPTRRAEQHAQEQRHPAPRNSTGPSAPRR